MVMLYQYLTGTEFRQHIDNIVEAFNSMKKQLDTEKKVFIKLWAEREKQLDRVLESTVSMHGSVKGIAGGAILSIDSLETDNILLDETNP